MKWLLVWVIAGVALSVPYVMMRVLAVPEKEIREHVPPSARYALYTLGLIVYCVLLWPLAMVRMVKWSSEHNHRHAKKEDE